MLQKIKECLSCIQFRFSVKRGSARTVWNFNLYALSFLTCKLKRKRKKNEFKHVRRISCDVKGNKWCMGEYYLYIHQYNAVSILDYDH